MTTPWRDPLDADEAAEVDAREAAEAAHDTEPEEAMPEMYDPPAAPEPGADRTKPRDLLNLPVILLPLKIRTAHDPKKDEDFEVVDCRFWKLESTGVVGEGETGISWWRAREQLRELIGFHVACRPTQQADNSITLEPLAGAAREVAAGVIAQLGEQVDPQPETHDDYDEHDDDAF